MKRTQSALPSIIGCIALQLCVGVVYMWSVFKLDIVKSFDWSVGPANMVSSYMTLLFVIGNLAGGLICDSKGPKFTATLGICIFAAGIGSTALLNAGTITLIYATYSVVAGFGVGLTYAACLNCMQKWLPHRRGLATGMAVGAFGFSTVILAPAATGLMNRFRTDGVVNFMPVFLILAGVLLAVGLLSCIFVKLPTAQYVDALSKPSEKGRIISSRRDYKFSETIRTPLYWAVFFAMFFINGTWNLSVPIIKDLGMARGLSETLAVLAVSIAGVASSCGRLLMSAVSDKIGRISALMSMAAVTLICAVLMTFITSYAFIAVIAIIAFAFGGPAGIFPAACTDFFGSKHSGANYGFVMLSLGLSSVFFNFVSSAFLSGNVVQTYIMAAVSAALSLAAMLLIGAFSKRLQSE